MCEMVTEFTEAESNMDSGMNECGDVAQNGSNIKHKQYVLNKQKFIHIY